MEELKETELVYITIGTAVCPHCNMVNVYKTKKEVYLSNSTDEKKYKISSHCMYCGKDFLLTNVINGLIA